MKRGLLAAVGAFVVLSALEFVLHGKLLHDLYNQTSVLWRPDVQMKSMMWMMWLGYLIFAPLFVLIYSKGYEKGKAGAGQGLRYGFWMGLLIAAPSALAWYVVLPIPVELAAAWFAGGFVEALAAGLTVGLLYR